MTGIEQSRNKPQLRFPEFEEEWVEKKLGDITSKIGSGKTPKGGDKVYLKQGIHFIRSQNVINDRLILDETHISDKTHSEMKGSKVFANDILLNITGGSIGRSCVVPNDFIEGNVNQHVSIIRLKKDNPKFLQSILSSWRGQKLVFQGMTGSGREGLNFESIKGFKFTIPTPPEQTKIANFLTAVDKRINLLQKKKAELEQYKKGVMQRIFVLNYDSKNVLNHDSKDLHDDHDLRNQEIKNQGNQEYQAKSRFRLRFKQDDGSDFPDWEEKKLGEVSSITTGSSNRQDSGLDGEYTFFDRSEDIRTSNIYLFDGEAIIVGGEGSDFVPKYFVGKFDLHQRSYAIMNFKNASGMFLFYYIHYFRKYFLSQAVGSTVKSLRLPMFQKMPISLPCIPEQQKIANFLSTIDKSIEKLGKQIEQSQEWKKGLLQKMFV